MIAKRRMPFRVTFFSYKGGAGRSVACANVANHLVRTFHKTTAVFDFDIESVGQSYIHNVPKAFLYGRGETNWLYLQDVLNGGRHDASGVKETFDFNDRFEDLLSRMLLDVTKPGQFEGYRPDGSGEAAKLLLLARPVSDVIAPDQRAQQSNTLRSVLLRLTTVDFALFDSPSGTQPLAHLARTHSQVLVALCRPSRQFLEGTRYFLQRLVDSTREEHPALTVLVVLSALPMGDAFRQQRQEAVEEVQAMVRQLGEDAKAVGRVTLRMPEYQDGPERRLVIPEVSRLKWRDEVLPLQRTKGMDDESLAGTSAYRRLAEVLRDLSAETTRP